MNKKILCFLIAFTSMCTILAGTVAGQENTAQAAGAGSQETGFQETEAQATGAQLYYVTDEAGLLTEEQDLQLEQRAEEVSLKYGIGVYIVTVDDYQKYGTGDVFEVTYGIYHEYTMGEGGSRDGIMLLLSMNYRDWAMFCYGDKCEYAFDEYGQEQLEEVFLDNFADDDWYGGFTDYINECEIYMQKAAEGKPVRSSPVVPILCVSAFALWITFMIVGYMWVRMNNVAKQTQANTYITGNLNLTGQSDIFTHRTETRRRLQSSSSGSSKSQSGGGGSGRSGKF